MQALTLAHANALVTAVLEHGRTLALQPLSCAVLDAGGHLLALQRQDGASILRPQIAIGKAAGALALGMSSRAIGVVAAERPQFIAALGHLSPAGVVPAAGGVILIDADGHTIGAVGVTGDTSDQDEACALAGIAATGLRARA